MCDRFSADGFRTRATMVIRWRVLGVRATKGKTGKWRERRPGDSRTLGKRGVCVWVCTLCPQGGDPRAVSPFHVANAPRNRCNSCFKNTRLHRMTACRSIGALSWKATMLGKKLQEERLSKSAKERDREFFWLSSGILVNNIQHPILQPIHVALIVARRKNLPNSAPSGPLSEVSDATSRIK